MDSKPNQINTIMKSFASDNNSGIHPAILDSITNANFEHALGYGSDKWTEEAEMIFKGIFGDESETLFVFNGTGANSVALQIILRPYNSMICAETGHIYVDECGAPCKMTGSQVRPVQTIDGKLTPESIRPYLTGFGDHHHSQPKAIYISQCTELGTVYTIEELKALADLAHAHGMYIHMDGARLANAAVYLNKTIKEMTVGCGIDIVSFGGTKNGMMMGECVVILNPELRESARFIRKQSAQLASKMRFLSCQFIAYFKNDLWKENAARANTMAQTLYEGLSEFSEIRFTQKVESNALFLQMPRPWIDELLKHYFFYFWNESRNEIRLVTSFDTTEEDVNDFLTLLRKIAR